MRRNLTISFDEQFITHMDRVRGDASRGVWIERRTPQGGVFEDPAYIKEAKATAARVSPKLRDGITPRPKGEAMSTIRALLATESHPATHDAFGDHRYTFSPECLDRFAEQAPGLPVTVNFEGAPVGRVLAAERVAGGVMLSIEASEDIAQPVASPAFVATKQDWNDDYTDRLIEAADLKGIGMTDD